MACGAIAGTRGQDPDGRRKQYKPRPIPRLGEGKRRVLPAEQVLPPAAWPGPWTDEDKHTVVAAVRCGQVVLGRALADYELSFEEFVAWHGSFRHGPVPSASMVERRVLLLDAWEWLKPD